MHHKKTKTRQSMLVALMASALLAGCADGYDSPSDFDLGVRNTQMKTPDQESVSFSVSADGTTATVSWPLVAGASGHEVTFTNVDDPNNPIVVDGYEKKQVDGSKFTIHVAEDSKYQMTMRTLGNKKLGNTDDPESKSFSFSTLVPSVATIPSGTDITQFIQENPVTYSENEVAIELEANGEYTMSGPVDFNKQNVTFRGDKIHRPVVKLVGDGHFETYSGLKLKYINFDLTESTANGVIAMSKDNLPDSILSENRGYTRGGNAIKGIYVDSEPIYIGHCWFKNLPHAMLYDNEVSCAFWYFTVSDCIVQMKNSTKSNIGFINLYKTGKSVKNITIENSTIYNTVDNGSACFIRYQNESNSSPDKVFGDMDAISKSHTWKFMNSTLVKCYYDDTTHSGWRFCNNVRVNTGFFLTIDHSIFYNVSQLYRMNNSGTRSFKFNFFWNDGDDDKKRNNASKDTNKAPFASEYNPQFKGDISQELDFSQPNGGVDFTPQEYQISSNRAGDPRWLEPATPTEQ